MRLKPKGKLLQNTEKAAMHPCQAAQAIVSHNHAFQSAFRIWVSANLLMLGLALLASPTAASTQNICDTAAYQTARETGVPVSVLLSITRTETGRNQGGSLEPWPWTVNMEGKGKWFETEDAARAYVFQHFKRGARSFDVGCFQINYKWHGAAFRSIDQMFDPIENARYAAAFLKDLYDESGDWSAAAGAYHSRTPEYAQRYKTRFDRIRQKISGQPAPDQPQNIPDMRLASITADPVRINRYPLLQRVETKGVYGSLVPLAKTGGQALFQNAQPIAGID